MWHNTLDNTSSEKYVIENPRFDSGTPDEWNFFVDVLLKALVGQHVATGTPIYKYMKRVLKGDPKAVFLQQANYVGHRTVPILLP